MMSPIRLVAVLSVLAFLPGSALSAQVNEDELFGDEVVVQESDAPGSTQESRTGEDTAADIETELSPDTAPEIYEPSTRLGGRFAFDVTGTYRWEDLATVGDLMDPPEDHYATELATMVFLDARPSRDFRVYGEAEITYPFREASDRGFDQIVTITESFSDFRIGDRLFFRGGKHTVTWGVGYFFSPADIINLSRIDPEDPDLDPEGPVSLRMQTGWERTSLSLYLLPPVGGRASFAVAPMAETVVGRFELGAGGYAVPSSGDNESDLAGMATVNGSLRRLGLFGEAVLRSRSPRRYIRETDVTLETPLGLEANTSDDLEFSGTVGVSYSPRSVTGRFDVRAVAQYYFNGDGYGDTGLLRDRRDDLPLLLADGTLRSTDLAERGRHYAAARVTWVEMLDSSLSGAIFWYGSVADASGLASLSITWSRWKHLQLGAQIGIEYGDPGSELAPAGNAVVLEIRASPGAGSF